MRDRRAGGLAALLLACMLVTACASGPPRNPEDICAIFRENRDWYEAAEESARRWGAPIPVPMAIMYQESGFRAAARPPMRYFLGFIPLGRASSAFGYSQAKTPTWQDYQRESGNGWADRDDFADSMDFVQWYIDKSHRTNAVARNDAFALYLNYHEGWGGYRRGSYRGNDALIGTARRVEQRAQRYATQLRDCREQLDRSWLRRLFGARYRRSSVPPSTGSTCPLIHSDSSETRKATIEATSSGLPRRGLRTSRKACLRTPSGRPLAMAGVMTSPGATALARMRSLPQPEATWRISASMPAFATA
jgi:hypothetical protein